MDTLKGKQIMVWTFMGNARMYEALRDYGDRISQIGLFSFKVRATGEIYESGVAISDMTLNSITLGDYIFQSDMRNANNIYGANDVKGIATSKAFIETKANLHGVLLSNYKVVSPSQFAYVPDTSRRGDKISLGYNDSDDTYLVSSISIVFGIKAEKANELLSEYLFLYFCRPEFDRYARFHSWGSARETFSWNDMCKIKISLPPIEVQRKYVAVFKALLANHNGSEDIKSICPVLIKGAIEEGGR